MWSRGYVFDEIYESLSAEGKTINDLVDFIFDDRERLRKVLDELLEEVPAQSSVGQLLSYTIAAANNNQKSQGTALQEINTLRKNHGNKLLSSSRLGDNTKAQILRSVRYYFSISRSAVSELLTALEVRGVTSIGLHVFEMIPEEHLEIFVGHFEAAGKLYLLRLEIDVVAYDEIAKVHHWIEVKHLTSRPGSQPSRKLEIRSRNNNLKTLLKTVKNSHTLSKLWPKDIKLHWVIRGEGISEEKREAYLLEKGIRVHSQFATGINEEFESPPPQSE